MTAIVVDTSAIVAILMNEPEREWLSNELAGASARLMAAPTVLELGIVLESRKPAAQGIANRFLRDANITVEPFDDTLAGRAMDAWRRFGKGRHPAALTFGDCCTFALAEETGFPILCVGNNFPLTDRPVVTPPD